MSNKIGELEFKKEYLGDGVYAQFDGYHIILTLDGNPDDESRIALEPQVIRALLGYQKRVQGILGQSEL